MKASAALLLGLALGAPRPESAASGAFFSLTVRDLAASERWYTSTFGLHATMTVPRSATTNGLVVLEGDALLVELLQGDGDAPARPVRPESMRGFAKVGLFVDDFERTVSTLRSRGIDIAFGPYPAHDGQHANVIIRDNEGNLIQLFGR